jgi:hypothetical protein
MAQGKCPLTLLRVTRMMMMMMVMMMIYDVNDVVNFRFA